MAKPISFTKRDLEKKKQEKRLAKQQKKEERKSNGSPDKPGGLSIQLCKSEKKEFYIRYSS